jgi:hypothetical protein
MPTNIPHPNMLTPLTQEQYINLKTAYSNPLTSPINNNYIIYSTINAGPHNITFPVNVKGCKTWEEAVLKIEGIFMAHLIGAQSVSYISSSIGNTTQPILVNTPQARSKAIQQLKSNDYGIYTKGATMGGFMTINN